MVNEAEAKEQNLLNAVGIFIPAARFASALNNLEKERLKIPFCFKCNLNYVLPGDCLSRKLLVLVMSLALTIYYGWETNHALMLLFMVFTIYNLVTISKANEAQKTNTLPLVIAKSTNNYRYVIQGGPIYDAILNFAPEKQNNKGSIEP